MPAGLCGDGTVPAPKRTPSRPPLPCFEKGHKNRDYPFGRRAPRSKGLSCHPSASISAGCSEGLMLLLLIEDAAGGPSATDTYTSGHDINVCVRWETFHRNSKGAVPPHQDGLRAAGGAPPPRPSAMTSSGAQKPNTGAWSAHCQDPSRPPAPHHPEADLKGGHKRGGGSEAT